MEGEEVSELSSFSVALSQSKFEHVWQGYLYRKNTSIEPKRL